MFGFERLRDRKGAVGFGDGILAKIEFETERLPIENRKIIILEFSIVIIFVLGQS